MSPRQVIVVNSQDESVSWVEPLLIQSLDFEASAQGNAPMTDGTS